MDALNCDVQKICLSNLLVIAVCCMTLCDISIIIGI